MTSDEGQRKGIAGKAHSIHKGTSAGNGMIHLTATTVAEQSVGSRNHKSIRPESRSDPKWPFIKGH